MNYHDLSSREIISKVKKYLKGTGEYAERLACKKARIPFEVYEKAKRDIRKEENKKKDSELKIKATKQREQEVYSAKDEERVKKLHEDAEDEETEVEAAGWTPPAIGR